MRRACLRHGEASNDPDGRPDAEAPPSQDHDDHGRSKKFVILKGKAAPDYDVEFIASSGCFKKFKDRYSFHNVKVSGGSASADVKEAEEVLETPDELVVEEDYLPERVFSMEEMALFWNRYRGLSLVRRPSQRQDVSCSRTEQRACLRAMLRATNGNSV